MRNQAGISRPRFGGRLADVFIPRPLPEHHDDVFGLHLRARRITSAIA
jgi:hypothetical protein